MIELNDLFQRFYNNTPIIGMIHLAGDREHDRVKRALKEIEIYQQEGVDVALIENYHGDYADIVNTLKAFAKIKEDAKIKPKIGIGVNILPNEFFPAFSLSAAYGGSFIQLDQVAGKYVEGTIEHKHFSEIKAIFNHMIVLGGVHPKYYTPVSGSSLEDDLKEGMKRAEVIVVTGEATGKETPLEKIKYFKQVLGKHPLIVGSGLNPKNAYEQLMIADGGIVGSAFKPLNNTNNFVDSYLVHDFMDGAKQVRKDKGLCFK